ncbi:MAG: TlpA family protein disulfide reductase [Bryobacteraceae bacterium]
MRKGLLTISGFVAFGVLMFLLFQPDAHSTARPPGERQMMPDIAMATLDGGEWKLSDHRGKVVLVNLWASWCPPCRGETPAFVKLAGEFRGRGLETAGINMDEERADARRFVEHYRIPYPTLLPKAGDPLTSSTESLPTTFLIDRAGRVARMYVGAVSERDLRTGITALLNER